MKNTMVALFLLISIGSILHAQPAQTPDFKSWVGVYSGSLTYLDYTTSETVSMPMVAAVSQEKDKFDIQIRLTEWGGIFSQHYKYTLKNGTLNGWHPESPGAETKDGIQKAVYTRKGKDGNDHRPCTFRMTISGTAEAWSIRKEVLFDGDGVYFTRNVYQFNRVKPQ